MSFKIYPKLPTAPEDLSAQEKFNASIINSEFEELRKLKDKFSIKLKRYSKAVERLMLLNASSSAITIGSGIGSIATGATIIGIPISVGLGGVALAGSICTGLTTAVIKRYQKKVEKVIKLYDIVTSTIAVFETNISQALHDGRINFKEFQGLQSVYYSALRKLSSIDRKMETETQNQFQKSLMEEFQNLKKSINENVS